MVTSPSSCFPAKRGDLWGISTYRKNFLIGFSGVDDCWETYPLALTDTILCLTMVFATLLALQSVNEAICVCAETVMRLLWECFQILVFCVVVACFFPFLPLSYHYSFCSESRQYEHQYELHTIILFTLRGASQSTQSISSVSFFIHFHCFSVLLPRSSLIHVYIHFFNQFEVIMPRQSLQTSVQIAKATFTDLWQFPAGHTSM